MSDSTIELKPRDEASELITNGHIPSAVWHVAWPTVISTLIQTAYNLINRLFLGGLPNSDSTQAAAGLGGVVLMVQFSLVFGVAAGTSALASRFLGATENSDAEEVTRQSLILSVIFGVISMIPLALMPRQLAMLVGAQEETVELTASYLRIISTCAVPMFMYNVVTSALRSAGDARRPLYAGAIMLAINVVLDWILIPGNKWIPSMGIEGAAIATSASRFVGTIVALYYLDKSILKRALSHFTPHVQWFRRILNIGFPAAMQTLLWSTGFALYISLTKKIPDTTAVQAALTIAIAIEQICFMPGVAYSIAATPLVGQNLGAKKPKRAERCAWIATWHAAAIMSLVAVLFLAIPEILAKPFTDIASVRSLTVSYLKINAPAEPFLAIGMVLAGALQGAGDVRMPMLIEFIVNWPARLGLAWLLGMHLGYGAIGFWISMSLTTVLYGLLVTAWFQWGPWRTREV